MSAGDAAVEASGRLERAAGQRFLGTGPFLWIADVAEVLKRRLGPAAANVPTRQLPDLLVRAAALANPALRQVTGELGRRVEFSSDKARTVLGWSPRPVEDTIVDCAESLLPPAKQVSSV